MSAVALWGTEGLANSRRPGLGQMQAEPNLYNLWTRRSSFLANSTAAIQHSSERELSLRSLLLDVWRHRLIVLLVTAFCLAAALLYAVVRVPLFTARVTMLPQSESSDVGVLGRLASFAGTPLGGSDSYEGLYLEILRSDRLIKDLLDHNWETSGSDGITTLYKFFDVDQSDPVAVQQFKDKLRNEVIHFYREKLNGFMVLKVTIPRDPSLAAEMANFLVERLDNYNREFRTLKARRQREFVDSRLAQVERELTDAELSRAEFAASNKGYSSSPELMRQLGELEREVQAQTSIWIELRRQLEMAKIDEHKEIVSVDVLDAAAAPAIPSNGGRARMAFAGLVVGGILGFLAAAVRAQWQRA